MQGEETCLVVEVLGTSTDSEPKTEVSSEDPETYVSTQTCDDVFPCILYFVGLVFVRPLSF